MTMSLLEAESLSTWELFLFKGHFPHKAAMAESILPTRIVEVYQGKRDEKEGWVPMRMEYKRGAEGQRGLRRGCLCVLLVTLDTWDNYCGPGLGLWPE